MKVGSRRSAGTAKPEGDVCSVPEGLHHLVQLLPRLIRAVRRQPSAPDAIDGVVLGPRHNSALALIRGQETTMGALASALALNLATVSGLVTDLEQVGFVVRAADPTDRRRILVRVAPGQDGCVGAWLDGATGPLTRALERLSATERAAFIKGMGYLEHELSQTEGGPKESALG
jgi:DNA-binding MarR family transcriptional regulator